MKRIIAVLALLMAIAVLSAALPALGQGKVPSEYGAMFTSSDGTGNPATFAPLSGSGGTTINYVPTTIAMMYSTDGTGNAGTWAFCTATSCGGGGSAFTSVIAGTNITLSGPGCTGGTCTSGAVTITASATAATAFSALTGATNTSAAMLVGTGASLGPTGTGVVSANQLNGQALASLSSCVLYNTTATGVPSCATAAQAIAALGSTPAINASAMTSFPTFNQNTTGNASTATAATNMAGGALGSAPYQNAANTTLFVPSPTVNGVYSYGWNISGSAAAAPVSFQITGAGVSCTGSPLVCTFSGGTGSGTVNSGTAYSPAYYASTGTAVSGTTPFTGLEYWAGSAAPGAATAAQVVAAISTTAVTNSTNTTNLLGGAANEIAYQTGVGATGFITAAASCVMLTSSGNVISCGTTLPAVSGSAVTSLNAGNVSSGTLAAARGGTGVSNTATLTLGTSNQNWASLGTGIVKTTTTTGALTDAASADVYGLWSGTCSSSTFLRGDGACAAPSGSGTVTTTGSPSSGQMGAFSGSTSITAATAANLGSLVNLAQYDVVYSGGTAAALSGLAGNTSTTPEFVTSTGTGSAAQAPTLTSSTGSGNVVLATSPTLVTPALGTPASGVITNLTGTCASCNIGGTAANASTVANTGAQNANATYYFCFLAANTSTQQACNTSAGFTVNPSTGAVTLSGSGASNVAIGSAGSATGTLTLESATATGGVTLSPASAASQFTVTVPAATDTLVNLGSAQTLTSKTLTSPVINTGVTGTAVQGTDTLLMSAGTVAGTGASLCTDANGGATTSGCSGSSFPTGSTNQTLRFSGTNTGGATSAITVLGSAATSNVGIDQTAPIQQLEISGPIQQDVPFTGTVTFGASCSATATSCTISGGTNLNATGGVILASYNSGSNDGEYICYSAATSTTLTIGGGNCGTPVTTNGRSYWGSTAAVHPNGEQIAQVLEAVVASVTSTPARIALGNGGVGGVCFGSCPATQFSHVAGVQSGSILYALAGGGIGFSASPSVSGGNSVLLDSGGGTALVYVNSSNNAGLVAGQAGLSYNLTTQSITGNGTLTAITNATTAVFPNNNTAAAAGTGGVLGSICTIAWNQATSGTVQFGLKASAAPTDLWVLEEDLGAVATVVTPSQTATTITGTTTTATSAAISPIAFGTTYFSKIYLRMNPGTSNSVSVQLYASASANTLTIEPGTGCSAWQ